MNKKVVSLQKLIKDEFETESAFARKIGWTRQRLNKITNGVKVPDVEEVNAIAKGLGVSINIIAQFFLPSKSPNG